MTEAKKDGTVFTPHQKVAVRLEALRLAQHVPAPKVTDYLANAAAILAWLSDPAKPKQ